MKMARQVDERIVREQGQVYKQGFLLVLGGYFVCSTVAAFHEVSYLMMDSWILLTLVIVLFKMARRGVLFAEDEKLPALVWKLAAGYAAYNGVLIPCAFFYIGITHMNVNMSPINLIYIGVASFIIIFSLVLGIWMLLFTAAFRISRKRRHQVLIAMGAEEEE